VVHHLRAVPGQRVERDCPRQVLRPASRHRRQVRNSNNFQIRISNQ
jgi:hypothetical protein